jgi:hypothetical protein
MFLGIASENGDGGAAQILHCRVANLQRSPLSDSQLAEMFRGFRGVGQKM